MLPMGFTEVLAASGLTASVDLALALFLVIGMFADYRWQTAVAAVIAVGALNLFYAGGAPRVVAAILQPLHTLATIRPAPERPAETPKPWPP